ncbi:hypothetical protein BGZ80_010599 [Entomortierella chlamydospora]|uniref:Uncharacterized protein n=1 Tax=Entomortierella chlamydospora TaxID=101097 RepID=A0A9P6T090_9FUNG|nr:hypothetical protein BGZ79_007739 [Entomortierella chlamydospora]KAG0014181.1 hypothetical protein BGZ80_010599 [Entomortierella chlamydospora]
MPTSTLSTSDTNDGAAATTTTITASVTYPDYFDSFPDFIFRHKELPRNAFKRLAREQGWSDNQRGLETMIFNESLARQEEESSSGPSSPLSGELASDWSTNYFNRFPNFELRNGEHARNAFKRLAKLQGWSDMRKNLERENFHKSVVQDLNSRYSTLAHYQDLCAKLIDSETVPTSITQCKALLQTKYVNIWDIYEGNYRCFDTFKQFKKYTCNGRVFDRNLAKSLNFNVFLRVLGGKTGRKGRK